MNQALLAELQKEHWAMEPKRLNALFAELSGMPGLTRLGEKVAAGALDLQAPARTSRMKVQSGVAVIPVVGVLMKAGSWILDFFDIEYTTYADIRRDLANALADESVQSVLLHVGSPGGQVAGVQEAADAIFAAREQKPVNAFIEDLGASAAYHLASQAAFITANKSAEVGSIGVYEVLVDSSKAAEEQGLKVHLVRSGDHKGLGVAGVAITEEQLKTEQEIIDGLAEHFIAAVARGRDKPIAAIEPLATGRVWLAREAVDNDLIDDIGSFDAARHRSATSGPDHRRTEMPEAEENQTTLTDADLEAARKEAAAQATADARKHLTALKEAFPEDEAFAVAQFEAGATVDQAKVAYNAVLIQRLAARDKELGETKTLLATASETRPGGTPPVGGGGTPPTPGGGAAGNFVEDAKALAAEKKISIVDAMRELRSQNPAAHEAWIQQQPRVKKDTGTD